MDRISQPVDTLPENGTYTTSTDIDLELDYIYFEDGELEAEPERVLFTFRLQEAPSVREGRNEVAKLQVFF